MTFSDFWSVPRLWSGQTVAILATGPSLTQDQVMMLRGRMPVVVINDNYLLSPWADIHYFCDAKWYEWHRTFESPAQKLFGRERALALFHGFQGIRATIENTVKVRDHEPSLKILRNDTNAPGREPIRDGLCLEPDGIRTGSNSGYQALNMAVHTGAARILLLGYDMQTQGGKTHWFGEHPKPSSAATYGTFASNFESLVTPLKSLGVEVINCTPGSALPWFPRRNLADLL